MAEVKARRGMDTEAVAISKIFRILEGVNNPERILMYALARVRDGKRTLFDNVPAAAHASGAWLNSDGEEIKGAESWQK